MGGSGGWGRYAGQSRYDPGAIRRGTASAAYESAVEALLQDLLKAFNDRDVETIARHLDVIQDCLGADSEGSIRLLFGGSISKHTYVDGISDVDMLVCVEDSSLAGQSPDRLLAQFVARLKDRLPRTGIEAGDLAVTVSFADGQQIQLLPALRTSTGYRIAGPQGRWSHVIDPARFATQLTRVNQATGGKVVPVVKLFKTLNDILPKPSRLTGYHIESLAVGAFEDYRG